MTEKTGFDTNKQEQKGKLCRKNIIVKGARENNIDVSIRATS